MTDITAPKLTIVSPPSGHTIGPRSVVRFEIYEETDLDISTVKVEILQARVWEPVFSGGSYVRPYRRSGLSAPATETGYRWRFAVVRDGGWTSNPIVRVTGADVAGNALALVVSLSVVDGGAEPAEPATLTIGIKGSETGIDTDPAEPATLWPDPEKIGLLRIQMYGENALPSDLPFATLVNYNGTDIVHTGKPAHPTAKGTWGSSIVSQVDILCCHHGQGGISNIQFCHPDTTPDDHSTARNALVIHVGGHSAAGHYFAGSGQPELTYYLLRQGFYLLGVSMPVTGFDSTVYSPIAYVDDDGNPVTVTSHDDLEDVEDAGSTHGLRLFVDGIFAALNWLEAQGYTWDSIDIVGLSGGGWTTEMVALLDDRIRKSMPVFGSLPFQWRPPGDVGDWEQLEARQWWSVLLDHETQYALGAYGSGRKRIQILGTTDGTFPISTILSDVQDMGAQLALADLGGGKYSLEVDTTSGGHLISAESRLRIIGECMDLLDVADWTPADLGSKLKSWLRADVGVTYDGSNYVTAWADQASGGPTWTVNGTPDYEATGGSNSQPTVRFNSNSTEWLSSTNVNCGAGVRAFIVNKRDADPPAGGTDIGGLWNHGAANLVSVPYTDGIVYDGFGSTARKTTVNPSSSMASWNIYDVRSTASGWWNWLNGTRLYTTATNTVSTNAPIYLARDSNLAVLGKVRISECIVCEDLTEDEEEQVRYYLARKYRIWCLL